MRQVIGIANFAAMPDHSTWMRRALQLARLGAGSAAPNPLVGAVLVQGDQVLAEGWHQRAGGPHAEVECLRNFGDGPVPADATLYVSLEPCSHHGRTPPCADLLIARGVRHVVIAHEDPFPQVAGRGIQRLRDAGIQVSIGVCEAEARWTNRRFLTSVQLGRPYVILKWARSADGFLDRHPRTARAVQRISGAASNTLVHQWRSEEQAILVGSRTVLNDDPALTVRHVEGKSPIRVVLDRNGNTPAASQVYNSEAPTLLFTNAHRNDITAEQVVMSPDTSPLNTLLEALHHRHVRSVLVEGGGALLQAFLQAGLWDEARVITGRVLFGAGTAAPELSFPALRASNIGTDELTHHLAPLRDQPPFPLPDPTWPW